LTTKAPAGRRSRGKVERVERAIVAAPQVVIADSPYTFTQSLPLVLPTPGATEENLALTFGFTRIDDDGHTANGFLTLSTIYEDARGSAASEEVASAEPITSNQQLLGSNASVHPDLTSTAGSGGCPRGTASRLVVARVPPARH
jgi:hypothetical protein